MGHIRLICRIINSWYELTEITEVIRSLSLMRMQLSFMT